MRRQECPFSDGLKTWDVGVGNRQPKSWKDVYIFSKRCNNSRLWHVLDVYMCPSRDVIFLPYATSSPIKSLARTYPKVLPAHELLRVVSTLVDRNRFIGFGQLQFEQWIDQHENGLLYFENAEVFLILISGGPSHYLWKDDLPEFGQILRNSPWEAARMHTEEIYRECLRKAMHRVGRTKSLKLVFGESKEELVEKSWCLWWKWTDSVMSAEEE